jgi:hypothetical protein
MIFLAFVRSRAVMTAAGCASGPLPHIELRRAFLRDPRQDDDVSMKTTGQAPSSMSQMTLKTISGVFLGP